MTSYFYVADTESPRIRNIPIDIAQNTDPGLATAVVSWTPPTAIDNSGSQTLVPSHTPGDSFNIGNTTVTYTSTDQSANTEVKTFTVTIQGINGICSIQMFHLFPSNMLYDGEGL